MLRGVTPGSCRSGTCCRDDTRASPAQIRYAQGTFLEQPDLNRFGRKGRARHAGTPSHGSTCASVQESHEPCSGSRGGGGTPRTLPPPPDIVGGPQGDPSLRGVRTASRSVPRPSASDLAGTEARALGRLPTPASSARLMAPSWDVHKPTLTHSRTHVCRLFSFRVAAPLTRAPSRSGVVILISRHCARNLAHVASSTSIRVIRVFIVTIVVYVT
jgi:hypothetical protein